MRVLLAVVALLLLTLIAFLLLRNGDGDGVAPDGLELLRLSEQAMTDLRSMHVEVTVFPEEPTLPQAPIEDPLVYEMDLVGRRCVRSDQEGAECSCSAPAGIWPYFDREQGGQVYGPPFLGATTSQNVRVIGVGLIKNRPTWVVSYEFENPSVEGSFKVERREWIDKETYILWRQDEEDNDRFSEGGSRRSEISELNQFNGCPS